MDWSKELPEVLKMTLTTLGRLDLGKPEAHMRGNGGSHEAASNRDGKKEWAKD